MTSILYIGNICFHAYILDVHTLYALLLLSQQNVTQVISYIKILFSSKPHVSSQSINYIQRIVYAWWHRMTFKWLRKNNHPELIVCRGYEGEGGSYFHIWDH